MIGGWYLWFVWIENLGLNDELGELASAVACTVQYLERVLVVVQHLNFLTMSADLL